MGKIIQLSDKLSNLIAAGEVVENMASVVKELVENSIDANSTSIQIDLLESGLNEIKVTDDGDGMAKEDMKMALQRHATSKIKTEHDLFHIQSLGFRGEALPSIASVSHFEMISSFEDIGYRIFYLKGELQEEGEYAPKKGTTITVRYLFYNTPARLKHLKATTTELSYIVDYVNKIALSHPEIKFTLTNDKRVLFRSNGNNDYLQVLSNIYNIDIIKEMVPFTNENSYFHITGYCTKPLFTRSTRQHVTVIANNRMIKNNKIINAVIEGYRTYLPVGKYPIVFLKIDLDPLLIDVNVHPQKLEVKFTEERMLSSLITKTILDTLRQQMLIPKVEKQQPQETYKYESLNLKTEEQPSLVKEDFVNYLNTLVDKKKSTEPQDVAKTESLVVSETKKLPRLEYIGQFMGTYLLAQNEEGLYIIDQHAAAERIRYERYVELFGNVETNPQELLIPMTLNLSNHEVLQLQADLDKFTPLGITAKANEYQGIDIYTVPSWFPEEYELSYTEEIAKYILDGQDVTVKDVRDSLAKNLSCKHSIKANKYINKNEIETLLKDLSNCQNPYTCPHGRPVIIHFTVTEIEKIIQTDSNMIVAIVGPTGIGKTKLSVALAKKLDTDIISGDSIQVYKHMDIGSAKVTESEKDGIVHHLIDIIEPTEPFSVALFQQLVRDKIKDVEQQGKTPLIVGGTGLYIKSVLYDYNFQDAKRDPSEEQQYLHYNNDELYEILLDKDPDATKKIHKNNRKRVIQAILRSNTNKVSENNNKDIPLYDFVIIGLRLDRKQLYPLINQRVDAMMEAGLVEEVKHLYEKGLSKTAMQAIGYKELISYFEGKSTLEEAVEKIKQHSRNLAKKQYTFFEHQFPVSWIDVDVDSFDNTIEDAVSLLQHRGVL